jgi:hypothetical protein
MSRNSYLAVNRPHIKTFSLPVNALAALPVISKTAWSVKSLTGCSRAIRGEFRIITTASIKTRHGNILCQSETGVKDHPHYVKKFQEISVEWEEFFQKELDVWRARIFTIQR